MACVTKSACRFCRPRQHLSLASARSNKAMCDDDEAVRNEADDSESGTDLELFRQLVATPPKKCRRTARSSMSLCGVATSNCPNKTRKQCSGSRHRRNGVSATSHRTSRIIDAINPLCRRRIMRVHRNVGKKAMIVTLLLAVENGARRLCLTALCTRSVSDNSDSR